MNSYHKSNYLKCGYVLISIITLLFRSNVCHSQSVTDTLFRDKINMKLLEKASIDELNRYRKSLGLKALIVDSTLSRNARSHSNWMMERKVLEHSNYGYGECILYGGYAPKLPYTVSGVGIINTWRNSPPHNRIMTTPYYTKVGFGVSIIKDSYNGLYSTLIFE